MYLSRHKNRSSEASKVKRKGYSLGEKKQRKKEVERGCIDEDPLPSLKLVLNLRGT